MFARHMLYIAKDRFSGSMDFKELPYARQCAFAIQEIKPVVSYCCYFPWLTFQRDSDIFVWLQFSLDGGRAAIIHHKSMTSPCCLWIYRSTVQDVNVLNLLGSILLFSGLLTPCLPTPGAPANPVCGTRGRTKGTASSKTGTIPAPSKDWHFPFASSADRLATA